MSRTHAPQEEPELVRLLRCKNDEARTTVVRRYHSALVRKASLVLRSESAAEDVVQEAWLAAFESIDHFRGPSLYTWLVRIVLNKASSQRRRDGRCSPLSAHRIVGSRDRLSASEEEPALEELTSHEITPEWLLLEREAIRRLDHALHALSARQRAVLLLRDIHGVSPTETCRVLAINDLTQRVRLSRARASLRLALEGDPRQAA